MLTIRSFDLRSRNFGTWQLWQGLLLTKWRYYLDLAIFLAKSKGLNSLANTAYKSAASSILRNIQKAMSHASIRLSKEQENALETFRQYLPRLPDIASKGVLLKKSGPALQTGFVAANTVPFKKTKLPRESHWAWNQSNAKISVRLNCGTLVTFRKISPRKRLSAKAPFYKIWLYHIHNEKDLYFLWCEKGEENKENQITGVMTEIGEIYPQELSLSAFSFLRPFLDADTATSLGW